MAKSLLPIACFVILLLNQCKEQEKADPCSSMKEGYVVGFSQCSVGKGFVVTTLTPPDTLVTFNLPDTLYDFSSYGPDLYRLRMTDFLFPPEYDKMFPIAFSYEYVAEEHRTYGICPAIVDLSHEAHTVKREVRILYAEK